MLVLSRKSGQSVLIEGDIEVAVRRIAGGRVTLAFRAPEGVTILRSELAEEGDRLSAVGSQPSADSQEPIA